MKKETQNMLQLEGVSEPKTYSFENLLMSASSTALVIKPHLELKLLTIYQ